MVDLIQLTRIIRIRNRGSKEWRWGYGTTKECVIAVDKLGTWNGGNPGRNTKGEILMIHRINIADNLDD